jgi:hypothetical protein
MFENSRKKNLIWQFGIFAKARIGKFLTLK